MLTKWPTDQGTWLPGLLSLFLWWYQRGSALCLNCRQASSKSPPPRGAGQASASQLPPLPPLAQSPHPTCLSAPLPTFFPLPPPCILLPLPSRSPSRFLSLPHLAPSLPPALSPSVDLRVVCVWACACLSAGLSLVPFLAFCLSPLCLCLCLSLSPLSSHFFPSSSSPMPPPLSLLEPSITSSLASPRVLEGGQLAALVPSCLRQSLEAWGPPGPSPQPLHLYPSGFFLLRVLIKASPSNPAPPPSWGLPPHTAGDYSPQLPAGAGDLIPPAGPQVPAYVGPEASTGPLCCLQTNCRNPGAEPKGLVPAWRPPKWEAEGPPYGAQPPCQPCRKAVNSSTLSHSLRPSQGLWGLTGSTGAGPSKKARSCREFRTVLPSPDSCRSLCFQGRSCQKTPNRLMSDGGAQRGLSQ